MRKKVSIIGAGMTGSTIAHWLAEREIVDIVMIDVIEGMPQGKALDLQESLPVIGKDVTLIGSNSFDATENSDVVVITAGLARKPGMNRDDLLQANAKIITDATQKIMRYSSDPTIVVLTNPLDAMAYLTMKVSGLTPDRVIGQAGVLDSARMRTFISLELGISVENIHCYVLGGHGDEMVPLTHISNVAGIPLDEIFTPEKLEAIVERTRMGGGEIVNLLKTGSAYYAPAASVTQMVEAILKDKHLIVSASAYLNGEYEIKDLYFGVPIVLGCHGVCKIMEYKLSKKEYEALKISADKVRENIAKLKAFSIL